MHTQTDRHTNKRMDKLVFQNRPTRFNHGVCVCVGGGGVFLLFLFFVVVGLLFCVGFFVVVCLFVFFFLFFFVFFCFFFWGGGGGGRCLFVCFFLSVLGICSVSAVATWNSGVSPSSIVIVKEWYLC